MKRQSHRSQSTLVAPRPYARIWFWCVLLPGLLLLALAPSSRGSLLAQADAEKPTADPVKLERLVVPLPIVGNVDTIVRSQIDRWLKTIAADQANVDKRPLLVLEFRPAVGTVGEGSEYERALSLARFLASERLGRVRTVAFVPQSIEGHSVLPILACEQLVIGKDAEIGNAGRDEAALDPTVRRGYSEIAERRQTIPAAVALGMLDNKLAVTIATTPNGRRFVLSEELEKLRAAGEVTQEETLFHEGKSHKLSGRQLRLDFSFASHLASDLRELATALEVPVNDLTRASLPTDGWKPIRMQLSGNITRGEVNGIIRALRAQLEQTDANLLLLEIDCTGGSIDHSRRLAQELVDLRSRLHTVAIVEKQALSDAAIVALSCHELRVTSEARLGGAGAASFTPPQLATAKPAIMQLAEAQSRDWSLMMGMIDRRLEVFPCTREVTGQVRLLSEEEREALEDAAAWKRGEMPVSTLSGIVGSDLIAYGQATPIEQKSDILREFQLESDPPLVQESWALEVIRWMADPRIAGLLLFVGWFALMFEMSSPGVGVPGFIAALCFLLYFWSAFLNGTSGWLEVMLFLFGIICILAEIFFIPGTGFFGIGGAIAVIVSIVLASQTFVIPSNVYQFKQLPFSLSMVAAGLAGGIGAVVFMHKFLPHTPYLKHMMLLPPTGEELEALEQRETIVDLAYLAGKQGVTTTKLVPSGKALFGDELIDVLSDGELIELGTNVVVKEVLGNRVVVKRA